MFFDYMRVKFQVAGLQTKRFLRRRSIDFVYLFLLGHILDKTCKYN